MTGLKKLSQAAVPGALAKVERYRLLNEPWEAESICRDVLDADPENHEATISLILALSDQFASESGAHFDEAAKLIARLASEFERAYYTGILLERRGKASFERGTPSSGHVAHGWLIQAMEWYEKAEALQPAGKQDATLRWNTCLRMMRKHASIRPDDREHSESMLE